MKKFLLTTGILCLVLVGYSQLTVLNELYTDPGNQALRGEFIELYNASADDEGQNVDCYTIVTYYDNGGGDRGWYVLDLPNLTVGAKDFFVAAAFSPFTTQNTPLPGATPDFSWNDPLFRNGSTGGSLTKWRVNGSGYTNVSNTIPTDFNNLLSGGQGEDYIVLVFVDGAFNNGFIGGSGSAFLSGTTATPLPGDLHVDMNGTCTDFDIVFSELGAMENVGSQPGSDNGYARTSDGKCGSWQKTSTTVKHTPGATNGSASGLTGSLTTAQEVLQCQFTPGRSALTYDITGVTGDASEIADFGVEVRLYWNRGDLTKLDGPDSLLGKFTDVAIADPSKTFIFPASYDLIIVYQTARGCFDKVVIIPNGCLNLPVHFKSFTANRNRSAVALKWETSSEQNSDGFAVERNISGVWQEIAYVPSQAINGNSDALLTYTFTDINMVNGMSQYRIKQVDLDGKFKNSEIRAVRGEGQLTKTVVYPNPTSNGKVTVVFEDATSQKDVSLIDMTGRAIRQWKGVTNNNIQIDNLTPGVFSLLIVIPQTGEQSVEKIVVNKR